MTGNPYDYSARKGVHNITWNVFHGLTKSLVAAVAPWQPEIILPVGRGGFYPGSLIAHILQTEIFPVRLTRRNRDVIVRDSPTWLVPPPAAVAGHRVLVVDEICSTGETLSIVCSRLRELGANEIRTAVLYAHSSGTGVPDYIGLITDELLMNPWDREIYQEGEFKFHPEYVDALNKQGYEPTADLLIPAPHFVAEKSVVG